jgi:hypothetical protein
MDHSPARGVASQEILLIECYPNALCSAHKSLTLVHTLSQMNRVHSLTSYTSKLYFNSILPSKPRSSLCIPTKTLHKCLSPTMDIRDPFHPIVLNLITLVFGEAPSNYTITPCFLLLPPSQAALAYDTIAMRRKCADDTVHTCLAH